MAKNLFSRVSGWKPTNSIRLRRKTMSVEDRAKATAKNIEGKIQEAAGNVTGDASDKMEGKAKQSEAEVRHAVEDVKDAVKRTID